MRFSLRPLLTQFSIRDLLWLTLVVAAFAAWWQAKGEIAVLWDDNLEKSEALQAGAQAIEAANKKEARLRTEVELLRQATKSLGAGLAKKEAELQDSLRRREEVIEALRILKDPAPTN